MEIPYTVSTRPDTGLWNAKVGIWLFLASEVMLFGGLFSAYIFLRLDAPPGMWPHGLLNVPVGTMNTAILILSSVTVVLAWAALKMRRYRAYWWYMLATIACGVIFLTVKLVYEWPQKFEHFGVFIKPEALAKYEQYLGNEHAAAKGLQPRIEITGNLDNREAMNNPPDISQDPSEHEEYAHNVQKHVRGYLWVGAILLGATALTVALSYFDFGTRKANIAIAMLLATGKAGLVAAIFMHLMAEK